MNSPQQRADDSSTTTALTTTLVNDTQRHSVILCSICSFTAFRVRDVVNHLSLHSGSILACGLDSCTRTYTNLRSFKSHLEHHHPDFYPDLIQLPEFSNNSIFTNILPAPVPDLQPMPETPEYFAPSPAPLSPPQASIDSIDRATQEFLEIILKNGCNYNIPFKAMQELSTKLVRFIHSLSSSGSLNDELVHSFLHSLNSQDNFDRSLEKHFNANFPEVINIRGSNDSFVCFPFKPALDFLLSKFSNFNQILSNSSNSENQKSFFSSSSATDVDTVYINLYVDDFQLANPLLKKRSLKNSVTGIYFRVITTDNLNFSRRENIGVLSLVNSKTFKEHSGAIFEYISQSINPLLDGTFVLNLGGEARLLKLKVGFFSTDSLAASSLLGMKKSFNHQFCCRFCTTPKDSFSSAFTENLDIVRTHSTYLESLNHVSSLEDGQDYFGIAKESCLKHLSIPNYSCLFPPCIDHDIFEGVLPKMIKFSLTYFISKRFFSFSTFNSKVRSFKLSGKDKANFPLVDFDLVSRLRFTASEGYTFSRFYLLFLDNVPVDDPVYIIVVHLVKIIQILMSFNITPGELIVLENLISVFLRLCSEYDEAIGGMTVKFHHLIHYPRLIKQFGPPRVFSTINFESLHSYLKSKIKNSKNWRSTCYTIATKYVRSQIFSETKQFVEFGCTPFLLGLPSLMSSLQSDEVYSLTSLKMYNSTFKCFKSAILLNQSIETIQFLYVEQIFKISGNYFLYGTIHDAYSETEGQYFLEPSQNHNFVILSSLSSTFSYEVYSKDTQKFIVSYFNLNI